MSTSRALATALRNGGVPIFRGIDDSFTSNLAAGSVNNTLADPGPGARSVIDSANRLSLSGGSAVFSTAAANDPRMAYDPLVVVPGRISILELTPADISQVLGMEHTSSATNVPNTFQFNTSGRCLRPARRRTSRRWRAAPRCAPRPRCRRTGAPGAGSSGPAGLPGSRRCVPDRACA